MALFLAGPHGIGKSHWIRQFAQLSLHSQLPVQGFLTYFKKVLDVSRDFVCQQDLARQQLDGRHQLAGQQLDESQFAGQNQPVGHHAQPSNQKRNTKNFWKENELVGQILTGHAGSNWFDLTKALTLVRDKNPDLNAFSQLAIKLEITLEPMKLTVFDEVGFFEKDAKDFAQVILRAIHQPFPLVGVMKEQRQDWLSQSLSLQKNVRIFHVTAENIEEMKVLLQRKCAPTLAEHLQLKPGMYAFIGGGGKTSTLFRLAAEYSQLGYKVAVVPSTKMGLPHESTHLIDTAMAWKKYKTGELFKRKSCSAPKSCADPKALLDRKMCADQSSYCVIGKKINSGGIQKLTAPDFVTWAELKSSFDYVLLEADGTRGLPLKLHASYEPVIPDETDQTVGLFGLKGLGMSVKEGLHRYELAPSWLSFDHLDVEATASILKHYPAVDLWLFNQIDALKDTRQAQDLAQKMSIDTPVFLVSVKGDMPVYEKWEMGRCIY